MIRVREYQCPHGHIHELFAHEHPDTHTCPVCGEAAVRLMSAPRTRLEGITGDFPGAAMAWERKRAEHMKVERKRDLTRIE